MQVLGILHKRRLAISEKPAGDYSEKIFNVYDLEDRKDLIRFHVRTEKRPKDGYFYNFHYHIAEDDLQLIIQSVTSIGQKTHLLSGYRNHAGGVFIYIWNERTN